MCENTFKIKNTFRHMFAQPEMFHVIAKLSFICRVWVWFLFCLVFGFSFDFLVYFFGFFAFVYCYCFGGEGFWCFVLFFGLIRWNNDREAQKRGQR